MVKRTQCKRSTRRTARTKKAMSGGFSNPFSSLRTRAEDKTENIELEKKIKEFCDRNSRMYNYIGGKNKDIDISPIHGNNKKNEGGITQFKNSLSNFFNNQPIDKVGVYGYYTSEFKGKGIKPLSSFMHGSSLQGNGIQLGNNKPPYLTRNTLKLINGGKRLSEGGRQQFKYLYVIGCRDIECSTVQSGNPTKPQATMPFAPVSPSNTGGPFGTSSPHGVPQSPI